MTKKDTMKVSVLKKLRKGSYVKSALTRDFSKSIKQQVEKVLFRGQKRGYFTIRRGRIMKNFDPIRVKKMNIRRRLLTYLEKAPSTTKELVRDFHPEGEYFTSSRLTLVLNDLVHCTKVHKCSNTLWRSNGRKMFLTSLDNLEICSVCDFNPFINLDIRKRVISPENTNSTSETKTNDSSEKESPSLKKGLNAGKKRKIIETESKIEKNATKTSPSKNIQKKKKPVSESDFFGSTPVARNDNKKKKEILSDLHFPRKAVKRQKLQEERKLLTNYARINREVEQLSSALDYAKKLRHSSGEEVNKLKKDSKKHNSIIEMKQKIVAEVENIDCEKTRLALKITEPQNSLKDLEASKSEADKEKDEISNAENHFHAVNADLSVEDGEEATLAAQLNNCETDGLCEPAGLNDAPLDNFALANPSAPPESVTEPKPSTEVQLQEKSRDVYAYKDAEGFENEINNLKNEVDQTAIFSLKQSAQDDKTSMFIQILKQSFRKLWIW